jgi:transcription elongation factor GreA
MQVPTRRADKLPRAKIDARMTLAKFNELKANRERLIRIVRPKLTEEVKHLASMGDFSENAGYQLAKSRLRGINNKVLEIDDLIRRSEIIEASTNGRVSLGNSVTLEINGRLKVYQILGSTESNPSQGIISASSPIGSALLDKQVGDVVDVNLADKIVQYKIIKID